MAPFVLREKAAKNKWAFAFNCNKNKLYLNTIHSLRESSNQLSPYALFLKL